jgi:hypothetical protein
LSNHRPGSVIWGALTSLRGPLRSSSISVSPALISDVMGGHRHHHPIETPGSSRLSLCSTHLPGSRGLALWHLSHSGVFPSHPLAGLGSILLFALPGQHEAASSPPALLFSPCFLIAVSTGPQNKRIRKTSAADNGESNMVRPGEGRVRSQGLCPQSAVVRNAMGNWAAFILPKD